MNANKKCKTYHFNQEWELEFFFVDIKGKCVCLICRDTLSIFKRGNIERHYRTKHADFDLKFPTHSSLRQDKLKTMKLKLNQEQSVFKNPNKLAQNVTIASFKVAYLLAKKRKPFSDGELIKEAFKEASDSLFTDFKNKSEILGAISSIQLSSNTVMRRIGAISSNQKTQLQTDLSKCSYFSLQMDESNDMIDTSQLSIFIKMCFDDFSVKEEFLKVLSLTGRTRGVDIYKTFKQFVEEEEIPIEKLAIININNVMELVVKIVNSIRGKALKRRLFRELMDEVDCHYGDLLLHSNVRWLIKELQGKEKQIIDMISHLQAFSSKLAYWENNMKNGDFQRFNDFKILEPVAQFISNPLTGDVETKANEIGNLFNLDITVLEMEIITLQNDSILKITSEFWKHASSQKYPNLRSIALRITSFFGSTWLCESTFSSMKYLKNKYRSRITDSNLDSSLRAAVSNYIPQFSKLAENQCQVSH
ncbi:SCAN domain-containing protein 3-like [Acyrthosiphon pisum]|uniref:Uncharacterized protein n=1 Tax=Acyrthosiphon pisum TaxID=7029 RepID=A0A8R2B7R5_ACYPI|nr:SCAN domain-containing protein 3-like [Acyrthosiphon pisum]|eukprot:XP_008185363.1 PREDICTED: SCAN domain-containing protein 3-like [Acyrthosiphon pisum]